MNTRFRSLSSYRVAAVFIALVLCLAPLARPLPATAEADPVVRWGVGTLSDEELWLLVSQMTLLEKTTMLHGATDTTCSTAYVSPSVQGCVGQAGYVPGVARLGIPPLRLVDGPAGIRLSHEATALPAPVGLAATFDREAALAFGVVMGAEGRAINQDVLLAPMINQVSVPTAGRNFETLGEDPYLMAELVAPQIQGIQGEGLIATLKHYAMNDFENGRNATSVAIDEQSLMEMELVAFEAGVKAGAGSAMCAYNRVNDTYACSNDILQNQLLRSRFGFTGWVMSDWGATRRTSDMIYGLDMAMPSGSTNNGWSDAALANVVTNGSSAIPLTNDLPAVPAYTADQWSAALDRSVFRILKQMNNAGLLEGTQFGTHYTDGTPYVPQRPDLLALQPASFATALSIAEKSATLLKNDDNTLPLKNVDLFSNGDLKGVVLMGPTSVTPYIGGGGSANVTPYANVVSPFNALLSTAGPDAQISYVPGYDLDGELMPAEAILAPDWSPFAGQTGWLRRQVSTTLPASGQEPALYTGPDAAPDQLDPVVNYRGVDTLPAGTAWRWQGTFTAPAEGSWQLKIFVKSQSSAQLYVDGLANNPNRRINLGAYATTGGIGGSSFPSWDKMTQTAKSHDPYLEKMQQGTWTATFAAGETHTLDLRAYANTIDPLLVQFRWVPLGWQEQKINEAVEAAKLARKVIIFAYDEGTEGSDRGGSSPAAGMVLPGYQDALISAVAAVNPDTIVVLNTGDPVFMPWVDSVKSILQMWYPGQLGGLATADLLLGKANPGGRLPVTFPKDGLSYPQYDPNCTDTGINGNCPLYPGVATLGFLGVANHNYRAIDFTTNGIFVGYRWYDKHDVQPLFEFGYGLSYTQFKYSKLSVTSASDGGIDVTFRVHNVGPYAGDEIPQVYLGPSSLVPLGVRQAEKALVQFTRLSLAPGHWQDVTLHVSPRQLAYWSVAEHAWVVGAGLRTVYVGASSRDIRLQGSINIK